MAGWGNNWNNYGGGGGGFGGFNGGGGFGGGMRGMGGNMGGMGGGWGGGGPYGYNNMSGFNRPRFGGGSGGGGGGGNQSNKPLTMTDVKDWLDKQQPFVLQTVLKHCKELLTTKHNVPVEDMSDWYGDEDVDKNTTVAKSGNIW